ncbi:hypothetical protein WJ09_24915 [Burkholderia vietnamiensis]|nr:hypothetical protein WJ09_24915 [Burkholderia vietnamiensis]
MIPLTKFKGFFLWCLVMWCDLLELLFHDGSLFLLLLDRGNTYCAVRRFLEGTGANPRIS